MKAFSPCLCHFAWLCAWMPVSNEVWLLKCRYELEWLGVKFRSVGFLGEIWLPNMIVVYKYCVIATYHYCLQMFWFLRSWEILTLHVLAHPFSYSLSRSRLSRYRSNLVMSYEQFFAKLAWMVAVKVTDVLWSLQLVMPAHWMYKHVDGSEPIYIML